MSKYQPYDKYDLKLELKRCKDVFEIMSRLAVVMKDIAQGVEEKTSKNNLITYEIVRIPQVGTMKNKRLARVGE